MAKSFAIKFKRIMDARIAQESADGLVGTVLSIDPLRVSCYSGQWILDETDGDLQTASHVTPNVGDSVVLSGRDPFNIVAVL